MVQRQADGRRISSLDNSSNWSTFKPVKKIGLILAVLFTTSLMAQRYGVVDTDYILKNLPEYAQAKAQVDQLSTQWAGEVSALQSDLQSLKDALAAEQILLSPENLEKREAAIVQKAEEVLALQQNYFGPEGLLFEKQPQLPSKK